MALVERAGFDGIELRTFGAASRSFACDPALTAEEKIRAIIDGAGIDCSSLATGIAFDAPIWPPVVGRAMSDQEGSVREAKRAIDLAAQIEAPLVRVFGFHTHGRESMKQAIKRIGGRLRLACDHARNTGVRLVVENGGSFERAEALAELIARVNSPLLGASYDGAVGHVAGDDPAEAVATLGDRLWLGRVKDMLDGRPVQLGDGDRDPEGFVRALAGAGFAGTVVFDWDAAWFENLTPAEEILPRGLERLCAWAGQTSATVSATASAVA